MRTISQFIMARKRKSNENNLLKRENKILEDKVLRYEQALNSILQYGDCENCMVQPYGCSSTVTEMECFQQIASHALKDQPQTPPKCQ